MTVKKTRRLKPGAKIFLLLAALFLAGGIYKITAKKPVSVPPATTVTPETEEPLPTPTPKAIDPEQVDAYRQRSAVNPEYIGELKFDSGLLSQYVVHCTNPDGNEKYLTQTWDFQPSTQGAAFADYRNTLNDQNLIIYGHYVYYDAEAMFTPLESLKDAANYEANKYITLTIGEDEKRRYLITNVFYYQMATDSPQYYNVEYDAEQFATCREAMNNANFYSTGETIEPDDRWLTLQTCVRDHDELRQIIVAKELTE